MKPPTQEPNYGDEDTEYRRLLNGILLAVLLVCGLTLIAELAGDAVSSVRMILFTIAAGIVGLGFLQLRHSVRRATVVLVTGLWLTTAAATMSYSGVHSATLVVYPFLIVLAGWILGRRWLVAITAATVTLVIGLFAAELQGFYHPAPRANIKVIAAMLVPSLIAISFLTAVAHGSLTRGRDRAVELSEAMSQHNLTLALRERDLQLIMEHVPAGLASFDTGLHLRQCNTRYAALFGARPEDLVGHNVADYAPKQAHETLMHAWQQCLAGARAGYRRSNTDPRTGKVSVLDVELVPEFDQGRVAGLFGLVIDVTDKVAAEDQVRELNDTLERRVEERTAALEEATERLRAAQEELARSEAKATLNTLVASVSHELNTPIGNSVMAASTLGDHARSFQTMIDSGQLKRSDITRLLNALRGGIDLLQRSLQRAQDLLQNFRQVAADQASEQRRLFDLETVVREIVETLAPSLKRHPHKIVLDIPAGIAMDSLPGPLGQVIINLINNAYLHAFEGRPNGLLKIEAVASGEEVLLRVADNGVGISQENLNRLFQPFFSTKIGQGGTGLGMTIVENLVRKTLGGSIRVHSEPGVGTRFDIHLPLAAPEAPPAAAATPDSERSG